MAYSVLFVSACCITYGLQFHLGRKRNIQALPLALAMTASVLLFMIFMKLPFVGYGLDARQIASSRYMMTGVLGTAIALVASRYILRVSLQRLDDAALVFPLSMTLVKIGCFFAGCCFGIPGGGIFGITYRDPSIAYAYQVIANAPIVHDHTIPLHPVQLYEAIGCVFILGTTWFMHKRWTQPGSSFFFLLVLYLPLRVFAEFFRASDEAVWYGWKVVQLVSLLFWLLSLVLLHRNERKSFFSNLTAVSTPVVLVSFLACIIVLFLAVYDYLHFIEKIVIVIALVGTLLLMIKDARNWSAMVRYRTLILPLGLGVILFCSAQVSENSLVQQDTIRYNSVHVGVSNGNYVNTLRDGDGCGFNSQDYSQKYFMVGAGFSSFKQYGTKSLERGVSAFGGKQTEMLQATSNSASKTFPAWGVYGYVKHDRKWIGIGAGLNVGNLRYAENRKVAPLTFNTPGALMTPIMPSLYARLGPRRIFFFQYDLANAFPSSTPGHLQQLSFGSGFGHRKGFSLRFGTPVSHTGSFLNVNIPTRVFDIEGNYTWGRDFNSVQQQDQKIRQFRFSIRYHLNRD